MQIHPLQNNRHQVFGGYKICPFSLQNFPKKSLKSLQRIIKSSHEQLEILTEGLDVKFQANKTSLSIIVAFPHDIRDCFWLSGGIKYKELTEKTLIDKLKECVDDCRYLIEQFRSAE